MDPHLLRTFVTVTRLASFPAAARELGCTRAAVARHVAALERELGLPLLTRRPVVPTVAGARLLEHAVPLLLRLDAARAELTRLAAVPAGELTVAATPLAAGPRLLAALPGTTVRVTLRVRPHDAVPAALTDGTAHLGLVDGLSTPGDPLPPSEAAAPPAGTAPGQSTHHPDGGTPRPPSGTPAAPAPALRGGVPELRIYRAPHPGPAGGAARARPCAPLPSRPFRASARRVVHRRLPQRAPGRRISCFGPEARPWERPNAPDVPARVRAGWSLPGVTANRRRRSGS
ncbi:LysR family transcriptional regulator [Streptomyces somaliensis]|uniref:LysR family transcriptional regulator n=1 Tax=Streptomyces somaliensis TaxID=78355 RepID=UPI00263ACF6C|nr:LysR family transcriptional regulator [Streptomyces somaliensis]